VEIALIHAQAVGTYRRREAHAVERSADMIAGRDGASPSGGATILPTLPRRMRGNDCGAPLMLDRSGLQPLFFAPFVSSVMRVEPAWIDYNGHLNMAYYNVLFDRTVDEAYNLLGVGIDYVKAQRHSCYTAEVHLRYVRELHADDPVRVTFQLIAHDHKRLHYFEQLFHAHEGWVSATSENLAVHVDMDAKRTAPFPDAVMARLSLMQSAHDQLPRPQATGRGVGMKA